MTEQKDQKGTPVLRRPHAPFAGTRPRHGGAPRPPAARRRARRQMQAVVEVAEATSPRPRDQGVRNDGGRRDIRVGRRRLHRLVRRRRRGGGRRAAARARRRRRGRAAERYAAPRPSSNAREGAPRGRRPANPSHRRRGGLAYDASAAADDGPESSGEDVVGRRAARAAVDEPERTSSVVECRVERTRPPKIAERPEMRDAAAGTRRRPTRRNNSGSWARAGPTRAAGGCRRDLSTAATTPRRAGRKSKTRSRSVARRWKKASRPGSSL